MSLASCGQNSLVFPSKYVGWKGKRIKIKILINSRRRKAEVSRLCREGIQSRMMRKEGEETRETADLKNKGREGSFAFPKKEWHH